MGPGYLETFTERRDISARTSDMLHYEYNGGSGDDI